MRCRETANTIANPEHWERLKSRNVIISTDGALEPIYDKELSLLSATQTVQLRVEGIRCFKTSTRLNEGEDMFWKEIPVKSLSRELIPLQ